MTPSNRYLAQLRNIIPPGFDRDVVDLGWIAQIQTSDETLEVCLSPSCAEEPVIGPVIGDIRRTLASMEDAPEVRVVQLWEEPARVRTPLQDELMAEGVVPQPDLLGAEMARPDIAAQAGYREEGPTPLGGPGGTVGGEPDSLRYKGDLPVFQWEIDPADEESSGEAYVERDGWEYSIWWQLHPAHLVYVSIQAIGADHATFGGRARPHAVGRATVVNLVWDVDRGGVVAIYGTARDFRPFIDAFQEGCPLDEAWKSTPED